MSKDTEFDRITAWIDRLNSSVAAAKTDLAATENMVAGAEYELQRLRRNLSTMEDVPAPAMAAPAGTAGAGDLFNMKLRHPRNLREKELWLRLGSGC